MTRQAYDAERKILNFTGTRATDSITNTHVYLPKAAPIKKETMIHMKMDRIMEVSREYVKNNKQGSTLTKDEKDGLKSLNKRVKDNEIVIVETDKSGKFSVMNQDTYLEAGDVHVKEDR